MLGKPPYAGTRPAFYFGLIFQGTTYNDWLSGAFLTSAGMPGLTQADVTPKKIDKINNPSHEWSVADAWYGEKAGVPVGTWQQVEANNTSISPNDWLTIPGWPYHNTTSRYPMSMNWVKAHANARESRFMDGKTNAIYFDGHAASVRDWKGVGNPCFAGDAACGG